MADSGTRWRELTLPAAAIRPADAVLEAMSPADYALDCGGLGAEGLTTAQAARRRALCGPNAVASHRARAWSVVWHQLRSPLMALLIAAAVASFVVGEHNDAVIIGVIVGLSVGLGFVNEFKAEKAAAALHSQVTRHASTMRDGVATSLRVEDIVPGDVVLLRLGDIVPADMRLIEVDGLQCEESGLTGESLPVDKSIEPVPDGVSMADLRCCALMGTVVHAGDGRGVVVATGRRTEFGRIAAGLQRSQGETPFQQGLRRFSLLLVIVAGVLTTTIFGVNLLLQRPFLESLLFSLAIAVGITPQLLPAVVSTSLAAGSRALAHRKVLVKRLVCIEDLGDVDVLFTDKTGTLTQGRVDFMREVPASGANAETVRLGLLASEATTGAPSAGVGSLDEALWRSPATRGCPPGSEWLPAGAVPAVRPRTPACVCCCPGRLRTPDVDHEGCPRDGA